MADTAIIPVSDCSSEKCDKVKEIEVRDSNYDETASKYIRLIGMYLLRLALWLNRRLIVIYTSPDLTLVFVAPLCANVVYLLI